MPPSAPSTSSIPTAGTQRRRRGAGFDGRRSDALGAPSPAPAPAPALAAFASAFGRLRLGLRSLPLGAAALAATGRFGTAFGRDGRALAGRRRTLRRALDQRGELVVDVARRRSGGGRPSERSGPTSTIGQRPAGSIGGTRSNWRRRSGTTGEPIGGTAAAPSSACAACRPPAAPRSKPRPGRRSRWSRRWATRSRAARSRAPETAGGREIPPVGSSGRRIADGSSTNKLVLRIGIGVGRGHSLGRPHECPAELRRRRPVGRIRTAGPFEHRGQRAEVGRHRHQLADARRQRRHGGVADERRRARHGLDEDQRQRIDVGRAVELLSPAPVPATRSGRRAWPAEPARATPGRRACGPARSRRCAAGDRRRTRASTA